MKRTRSFAPKLAFKKVTITDLSRPELEKVLGGISGNCPPLSALCTVVRCVQPTTTVQHTYACL